MSALGWLLGIVLFVLAVLVVSVPSPVSNAISYELVGPPTSGVDCGAVSGVFTIGAVADDGSLIGPEEPELGPGSSGNYPLLNDCEITTNTLDVYVLDEGLVSPMFFLVEQYITTPSYNLTTGNLTGYYAGSQYWDNYTVPLQLHEQDVLSIPLHAAPVEHEVRFCYLNLCWSFWHVTPQGVLPLAETFASQWGSNVEVAAATIFLEGLLIACGRILRARIGNVTWAPARFLPVLVFPSVLTLAVFAQSWTQIEMELGGWQSYALFFVPASSLVLYLSLVIGRRPKYIEVQQLLLEAVSRLSAEIGSYGKWKRAITKVFHHEDVPLSSDADYPVMGGGGDGPFRFLPPDQTFLRLAYGVERIAPALRNLYGDYVFPPYTENVGRSSGLRGGHKLGTLHLPPNAQLSIKWAKFHFYLTKRAESNLTSRSLPRRSKPLAPGQLGPVDPAIKLGFFDRFFFLEECDALLLGLSRKGAIAWGAMIHGVGRASASLEIEAETKGTLDVLNQHMEQIISQRVEEETTFNELARSVPHLEGLMQAWDEYTGERLAAVASSKPLVAKILARARSLYGTPNGPNEGVKDATGSPKT